MRTYSKSFLKSLTTKRLLALLKARRAEYDKGLNSYYGMTADEVKAGGDTLNAIRAELATRENV